MYFNYLELMFYIFLCFNLECFYRMMCFKERQSYQVSIIPLSSGCTTKIPHTFFFIHMNNVYEHSHEYVQLRILNVQYQSASLLLRVHNADICLGPRSFRNLAVALISHSKILFKI